MSTLKKIVSASLLFLSLSINAETARIAVAANFAPTLKQLSTVFEQQTPHKLVIVSGSTGKLFAQIEHGAPFHAFLSADSKRADELVKKGNAIQGSGFIYARGQLVYWAPKESPGKEKPNFSTLRTLAMANPKLAPYGAASQSAAANLLDQKIPPYKTIFGSNITQTLQFIASGSVDAGFISLSQLIMMPEKKRGYWWHVPENFHTPLTQKAVLLKKGVKNAAALAFLDYLQSEAAIARIAQNGYTQ